MQDHEHSRFQFRLNTFFVLLTLIGASLFLTGLWHRQIVAQYAPYWYDEDHPDTSERTRNYRAQMERRFTPGLSLIAFVGLSGIWYAIRRRNGTTDVFIGIAFALPLISVAHPFFGAFPSIMAVELTGRILGLIPGDPDDSLLWLLCVPVALVYSTWPLFFRRYVAAVVLFLFMTFYAVFSVSYFIAILEYFGD